MHIYRKSIFIPLFIIISTGQFIKTELSFTAINYLHRIINDKFDHLSILVGFNWWRTHVIENMYRFGSDDDATIQLIKELFHLQFDDITFDVTELGNKPAKYFDGIIVGIIVGILEMYQEINVADFKQKDFEQQLSAVLKKHFDPEHIAAQAQKYIEELKKKKDKLKKEIEQIVSQLKTDEPYKNLKTQISALVIENKNAEQKDLNKFRLKVRAEAQKKDMPQEDIKNILKTLEVSTLRNQELILPDEAEQISIIQTTMQKNNKLITDLRSKQEQLENSISTEIAQKRKEIQAIESILHKEQVDSVTLKKELTNLITLIAKSHAESLEQKYIPHMPQIIFQAFLWKKANPDPKTKKQKEAFKNYYDHIASIAHIPLVTEYPENWDTAEYTFKKWKSLKPKIETAINKNSIDIWLTGKKYEQLTFALAGYNFWDKPIPALISSITANYTHDNITYHFPNCVEASILNFLIIMLSNDAKTDIDVNLLNTIEQNKVVIKPQINKKLRDFLTTNHNLAFMQTQKTQDAWNDVVQNLEDVAYVRPTTENAKNRFYEIYPGLRNILKIFNHLFFGNSSEFDALPVDQKLTQLCTLFSRENFKVTWQYEKDDVNTIDVIATQDPHVKTIKNLLLTFEIEGLRPVIFTWSLSPSHAFIPPLASEQQWAIEKPLGVLLLNKLQETTLLSLLPWVLQSIPITDVFNQAKTISETLTLMFMQNLHDNERKFDVIKKLLIMSQEHKKFESTLLSIAKKLLATLPDDPIFNDELYIIMRNYDIDPTSMFGIFTRSDNKKLFLKAIEKGYINFVQKIIQKKPILVNMIIDQLNGITPLRKAIGTRNIEMVTLLIDHGAHFKDNGDLEVNLLIDAVRAEDKDILALLINKGVDINAQDRRGRTALYIAALNGYLDMVVELIILGGSKLIMSPRTRGELTTPLHSAAEKGFTAIAALLINNGAYIDAKDYVMRTPLYYAVQKGHKDTVELLIADGANLSNDEYTLAISHRFFDIARILLDAASKRSTKNK